MRKILSVLMILLITTTVFIVPQRADANGYIQGANALKSLVIGSMEKSGVKFTSKEAKEKAYDAWNMKAYEMWQADEASGRNKDLWEQWDAIKQNPEQYLKIEPIPEKPGFGKIVIDSTAFGLAATIGWAIGSEISNAITNNDEISYLTDEFIELVDGGYAPESFGLSVGSNPIPYNENSDYAPMEAYYIQLPNTQLPFTSGNSVSYSFTTVDYSNPGYVRFILTYRVLFIKADGTPSHEGGHFVEFDLDKKYLPENEPLIYRQIPKPEHLPSLNPVPELAPLTAPNADLAVIKEVLPSDVPVEVVVPLQPELDPYWDGEVNDPYIPPVPGKDPETDPDKPPGKDPETDPDKPSIITPGDDIPPYERPDSDPRPGTDPEINPGTEPSPEYPEKTETTETPGLFEKLWEWLKAILDVLFKILSAIIALPFTLLELLWEFAFNLAKALFVPSDGFWDENINELKKVIWSDEIDNMIDDFESLGSGGGGMFKDMVVSLMGVDGLVVIDADSINSILENIHSWVRGVFYPLLILFNVNSMYKLIRGTSLVEATRGLANRSKGAE